MKTLTREVNKSLVESKVNKEMQHRIAVVIRDESRLIKKAVINQQKMIPKKKMVSSLKCNTRR
ncbi:MAG: hypothetical protein JJ714_06740 [Acidithiobacillus sp.]|nr:hypothetical protein [Acidithiobacillus sp.]